METVIFHIDVNSAFLSWEAVHRMTVEGEAEDLRLIPSIVGGDREQRHGVVLAKSTPAKKYGIVTGEPIVHALQKCPELRIVPSRHHIYEQYSAKFMAILQEYSPIVEKYSIDEAFMDMTGMEQLFGPPVACAHKLKDRIKQELKFTVNVGISNNHLLAKMAGDLKKPDLVHTLFPEEIPEKMWPLPVEDLFFVGKATAAKLHTLGIHTIGELAKSNRELLHSHLKSTGDTIWKFANGIDEGVSARKNQEAKGYSNETTLAHDVTDKQEAEEILLALVEQVSGRLRADGKKAEVVSVGMKDAWFISSSHQCVLQNPTAGTRELYEYACRLLAEFWDGRPIRLLSFYVSRLTEEEGRQLSLFDTTDYEKQEKAEKAMDCIREKFGAGAVKRAAFLKTDTRKNAKKDDA
ncbi:MAG: DNA polymerase IV [Lachnospiraceae bacterium]|nr:DNA polymerase IV [Lachnospiraceae bacterium]